MLSHIFFLLMRALVGVPKNLSEPKEVLIGDILSLAEQNDKWLIDQSVRTGSINVLSMNRGCAGALLCSMIPAIVDGLSFLGRAVQRGPVLTHDGKNVIEAFGQVKCPNNWANHDDRYLPLEAPLPPGCGFIQDLVKSVVKMLVWNLAEDPQPEGDWVCGAAHLVNQCDYITATESAAVIVAGQVQPLLAIRSFKPVMSPGRSLFHTELRLWFAPDGTLGLRWKQRQCDPTQLDTLADPPEKPANKIVGLERIYWRDLSHDTTKALCGKRASPLVEFEGKENIVM